MQNVTALMSILHKFTPKGQETLIKVLKENKKLLSTELGFASLPKIIAGRGKTACLESELLNSTDNLKGIATELLDKIMVESATKDMVKFVNSAEEVCKALQSSIIGVPATLVADLSVGFKSKKKEILKFLQNNDLNYLEKCSALKTPEEMAANFINFRRAIEKKAWELSGQNITRCQELLGDMLLDFQKIILAPQKNNDVLQLEKQIRNLYGCDFVYVRDMIKGTQVLDALEVAKKNNLPIPNNIVVSSMLADSVRVQGEHFRHTNGKQSVFFKADSEIGLLDMINDKDIRLAHKARCFTGRLKDNISDDYNTTTNPLHVFLHEIIHGEKKHDQIKHSIPEKFMPVVQKLTGYARESADKCLLEEVRTELRVAEVLNGGLPADKKAFLEYIS